MHEKERGAAFQMSFKYYENEKKVQYETYITEKRSTEEGQREAYYLQCFVDDEQL